MSSTRPVHMNPLPLCLLMVMLVMVLSCRSVAQYLSDVSQQSADGPQRALFNAIRNNDRSAVLNALHRGADPNGYGRVDTISSWIQDPEYFQQFWTDFEDIYPITSALSFAACKGKVAIVDLLLAHGAHVNLMDAEKATALMNASRQLSRPEQLGVLTLLLQKGALVNDVAEQGHTPLMYAAKNAHQPFSIQVLALLLQHGADIHAMDAYGETVLHDALLTDHSASTLAFLLDHGAEVNARSHLWGTALCKAAWLGFPACVKLLLERGADVTLRDDNHQTPLMLAAQVHRSRPHRGQVQGTAQDHARVLELLRQAGAKQ